LIHDREATLINAHIAHYEKGRTSTDDPKKDRKLLLHKKEIDYLVGKLAGTNLVLIPVRLHFRRNYAKIELALAAGKKKYDKREAIKRRETEREAENLLRSEKLKAQEQSRT
jgi:SsrA-binding protein